MQQNERVSAHVKQFKTPNGLTVDGIVVGSMGGFTVIIAQMRIALVSGDNIIISKDLFDPVVSMVQEVKLDDFI